MLTVSENDTPVVSTPARPLSLQRCIPLLVSVIAVLTIVIIPFKILGHGYLPIDDALRHAAKVVSGKSWSEIMVLADWVKMDHHAGWHAVLGAVHQITGWGPDALVAFCIFALFCAFCLAPLAWVRRPEVWLGVLLFVAVGAPLLMKRITYGRPLILSAAILMTLLFLWHRESAAPLWKRVAASIALFAAAAWLHGSWSLFALPAVAFALAQQWRKAAWLGVAWITGSFVGGMFTGQPILFLSQSVHAMLACFNSGIPTERLAIEFRPSGGDLWPCLVTAAVIGWRLWRGATVREVLNNAPFMLAALGFVLGLKTMRFWLDWGLPALLVWLALQLEQPASRRLRADSWPRLAVTTGLAAALLLATVPDTNRRWTANLYVDYLSATEPETAEWLPQAGGIVYHPQQSVFYRLFFSNPHADWQYVMGFEPTFMTPENLAGYRRIVEDPAAGASYEPWVAKMRAVDRLIVAREEPLPIPQLEWKKFGRQTWIGRPRSVASASMSPSL